MYSSPSIPALRPLAVYSHQCPKEAAWAEERHLLNKASPTSMGAASNDWLTRGYEVLTFHPYSSSDDSKGCSQQRIHGEAAEEHPNCVTAL